MYIFGGQKRSTENTNEFWAFDFITNEWSLLPPQKGFEVPCLDSYSSDKYIDDEKNSHLVFFAGFVGGNLGDYTNSILSYSLEEKAWKYLFENTISIKAPAPRAGAGLTILKKFLYIFGGTDGNQKFQDFWKFSLVDRIWNKINCDNLPDVNYYYFLQII